MVLTALLCDPTQEHKLRGWVNKCKSIYRKHGLVKQVGLESSTKFTPNKINFRRHTTFCSLRSINQQLLKELLACIGKPDLFDPLWLKIQDCKQHGKLIHGIDLGKGLERIYLNYEKRGNYFITSFEWNQQGEIYRKNYQTTRQQNLITLLKQQFGEEIITLFLTVCPQKLWDTVYAKIDERYESKQPCTYYFYWKYEPRLKQLYPKLKPLLKLCYGDDLTGIQKWYSAYQNRIVQCIGLTRNLKQEIELTLYFITDGYLLDSINSWLYSWYT
jgi:hypothetical protein